MINLDLAHKEFVQHLKEKGRSQATVLAYGKDIEQLVGFLTQLQKDQANDITKQDIEAFMAKLEKDGYTKKSISRKTNSTKTFFRFLKINEYITDDPAILISHPKFETPPPRILSKTEYRALRDACREDVRIAAIVEILLQTGVRIGELREITVDDVKIADGDKTGEIYIAPQHNTKSRNVPLNKAVVLAIENYLRVRPKTKEKALFVTKTGKPLLIRNIRTAIDRYFRLAGIKDAKVNDLRHTFIAHHLMRGTSLVLISKIVGHKRLATTEKYLDHIKTAYRETFKLEEL
jgi:site-specific recombinase XerD